MFCQIQVFLFNGTRGMVLPRRNMIKTSQKNFSPWTPRNMLSFFAYIFLKFWICLNFVSRTNFFCVFVLSPQVVVLLQDRFFPARHHKYAFETTKDMPSKTLACNALRVDVASAVRGVSQKSQWKGNIFAPGSINCGTSFLQIRVPTVFRERALPLHILK